MKPKPLPRKKRVRKLSPKNRSSKIICGLGNPGAQYELTRHNIGFLVLDLLADRYKIDVDQEKFQGLFGKGIINNIDAFLLKPQTYMNLSGDSVTSLCRFYKISSKDLIVVHDDLDFPFGEVRIKSGGSDGGHNGLRSLIEALGNEEFIRVRMGIGRPTTSMDPADYVLQRYSSEQEKILEKTISIGADAVESILKTGLTATMNSFNQRRSS